MGNTIVAVGKVEHGGAVQITACALPRQADPLPAQPAPKGYVQYLACLDAERCPADWADKLDCEGIYHE